MESIFERTSSNRNRKSASIQATVVLIKIRFVLTVF